MTKKTYRYEMHMHTSDSSACGFNTAREMTRSYIEAGFAGVVVTEHFFNGNCSISNELPWDDRVTE